MLSVYVVKNTNNDGDGSLRKGLWDEAMPVCALAEDGYEQAARLHAAGVFGDVGYGGLIGVVVYKYSCIRYGRAGQQLR